MQIPEYARAKSLEVIIGLLYLLLPLSDHPHLDLNRYILYILLPTQYTQLVTHFLGLSILLLVRNSILFFNNPTKKEVLF